MMNLPQELVSLIANGESTHLEFKRDCSSEKVKFALLKTLCAFANDLAASEQNGYLLIGINDDATFSGFKDETDENKSWENKIRQWLISWEIAPAPFFTIDKYSSTEGDIIAICIHPSAYICWLKQDEEKYHAYVRQGKVTVGVTPNDLQRLILQKKPLSFDVEAMVHSSLRDLSLDLFLHYQQQTINEEIRAANGRTIEQQLAHMEFFHLKKNVPTVCGLLLLAETPKKWLPNAYVQFIYSKGTSLNERELIADSKEIHGDLQSQKRILDSLLKAYIAVWELSQPDTMSKKRFFQYPESVLREFIMNALIHRDYAYPAPIRFYWFADRLEITNPGGLAHPLTEKEFRANGSAYRNPQLAATLKELGLIERYGNGIALAQEKLKENGNPPAIFTISDNLFKVTIYPKG